MERKEAIRGAYRMTGGNDFYDAWSPVLPERQSGMLKASFPLTYAECVKLEV